MNNENPNVSLASRARAAGRMPQEQGRLEQKAFQSGYNDDYFDTGDDPYLDKLYDEGCILAATILRNQGKLFATDKS